MARAPAGEHLEELARIFESIPYLLLPSRKVVYIKKENQ